METYETEIKINGTGEVIVIGMNSWEEEQYSEGEEVIVEKKYKLTKLEK